MGSTGVSLVTSSDASSARAALAARLLTQTLVSRAAELARQGHLDAAQEAIRVGASESPTGLDLLARIEAQRGRMAEAQQLWRRALEADPDNESYRRSLERARHPLRRVSPLFVLMLTLLLLAVVVAAAFRVGDRLGRLEDRFDSLAAVAVPPKEEAAPAAPAPTPDARALRQAMEGVRGISVTPGQHGAVIRFENGLFEQGTTIGEPGRQVLASVGQRLETLPQIEQIAIIGHTDATAVPIGSIYGSNAQLGMLRALAAYRYLFETVRVPSSKFVLSSAGTDHPSHARSEAAEPRNRTVEIRVR